MSAQCGKVVDLKKKGTLMISILCFNIIAFSLFRAISVTNARSGLQLVALPLV